MYPETIKKLIECFKKLPGIGEKTAERLSLSVLNLDEEIIDTFSQSLTDAKIKICRCKICNNLSESEICNICSDKLRDKKTICVVENIKNITIPTNITNIHLFIFELDLNQCNIPFMLCHICHTDKTFRFNRINCSSLIDKMKGSIHMCPIMCTHLQSG